MSILSKKSKKDMIAIMGFIRDDIKDIITNNINRKMNGQPDKNNLEETLKKTNEILIGIQELFGQI